MDLGGCEIKEQFQSEGVRGAWAYWNGSSQWRITKTRNQLLVIEGQPDRLPRPNESAETWLEGRSGSFRGFEIAQWDVNARPKITIFADPLCTRPVYFLALKDRVFASDKLATIALNCRGLAEPDWSGLLESAALGSLYSYKTTLKNAIWLSPGEAIEFQENKILRRWKNSLPIDGNLDKTEVRRDSAKTLQIALTKAIRETWIDPEIRLLLSGGLDSRILLALASGKRKGLTLEMYSHETVVAKEVAAAAGLSLDVVPAPDYEYPIQFSYLVTGAMHDARFTSHLGLVQNWRKKNIPGIVHGYFHNTMYRGWTAKRFERYPNTSSILYQWMGRNAYYFERYRCRPESLPRHLYGMLSPEGQHLLRQQLKELADSLLVVIEDGFDLTFERRLLEFVSRQVYFGVMLGWYEALDVVSPIFQPSIWAWYAMSRPEDRDKDWAIREVFLQLDHPIAKLPDSNTRLPVGHLKVEWRDRIRNQPWYPALRLIYQKTKAKSASPLSNPMEWGSRLRTPEILSVMEGAISELTSFPLFSREKMLSALSAYRSGNDELVDPLCALTTMGQWIHLITKPQPISEFVHEFDATKGVGQ